VKKRIIISLLVMCFILAGCGGNKAEKTVKPMSSMLETSSEETEKEYKVIGGDNENQVEMEVEDADDDADDDSEISDDKEDNTSSNTDTDDDQDNDVEDEDEEEEEEDEDATVAMVEKGTISTLKTKWNAFNTAGFTGGAEKEATALRNKILSTGNTSEYYKWTGKTIYVSPDGNDNNDGLTPKTAIKSLDSDVFYSNPLKPGDAVLFERGGLWRRSTSISAKAGVIYGCYGDKSKEKPTFYGSLKNYANESDWTPSRKQNVWKVNVADDDIGLIVFNHGELVGAKKLNGITALGKNGDYYFNTNDDTVYLYYDKGNPGKIYDDIEICLRKNCFGVGRKDVTIDNIRMKYFGTFGVAMCGNDNTTITNCEIGFIGGAIQSGVIRYGNGIQQWNSTDKQLVDNCWVYQCYDTGITWQGSDTYEPGVDAEGNTRINEKAYYKDITYTNNLLEYNILDFEFWHTSKGNTDSNVTLAKIINYNMSNNICRYTGYGWSCDQRPDFVGWAFKPGKTLFKNATGNIIKNNILDCTKRHLVYWNYTGAVQTGFDISGNSFYQHKNDRDEGMWYGTALGASNQESLELAVSIFDKSPKKVKWVD